VKTKQNVSLWKCKVKRNAKEVERRRRKQVVKKRKENGFGKKLQK